MKSMSCKKERVYIQQVFFEHLLCSKHFGSLSNNIKLGSTSLDLKSVYYSPYM